MLSREDHPAGKRLMKATHILFLLALYAIDFSCDSSFGTSSWAADVGNTLSISQNAPDTLRSPVLIFAPVSLMFAATDPQLPATLCLPLPDDDSATDLIYRFFAIRC
jgi:hypothetical protein